MHLALRKKGGLRDEWYRTVTSCEGSWGSCLRISIHTCIFDHWLVEGAAAHVMRNKIFPRIDVSFRLWTEFLAIEVQAATHKTCRTIGAASRRQNKNNRTTGTNHSCVGIFKTDSLAALLTNESVISCVICRNDMMWELRANARPNRSPRDPWLQRLSIFICSVHETINS